MCPITVPILTMARSRLLSWAGTLGEIEWVLPLLRDSHQTINIIHVGMREIGFNRPFRTSLIHMFSQRTNEGGGRDPFSLHAARENWALVLHGVRSRETLFQRRPKRKREIYEGKLVYRQWDPSVLSWATKAEDINVPDMNGALSGEHLAARMSISLQMTVVSAAM